MNIPHHLGIIPDGNRRFAKREGISIAESYLAGSIIALAITQQARALGVKHISFFATSNENVLRRPTEEIQALRVGGLHFCGSILSLGYGLHIVGNIEKISRASDMETFQKLRARSNSRKDFVVHVDVNYSGEAESELAPLFQAISQYGLAEVR